MILSVETSTISCSVALSHNGNLLCLKESRVKNSHSSIITILIKEVLDEAKVDFELLDAIAVSKGPGSYTGLRIGVSTAKGLCYALDKPLISVKTLQAMASGMLKEEARSRKKEDGNNIDLTGFSPDKSGLLSLDLLFCPMLDARRMEVYHAIYDTELKEIKPTSAEIITNNTFEELLNQTKILFFGDGAAKCSNIIDNAHALFIEDFYPSAKDMTELAEIKLINKDFEDVAYFEPYYLKEFVAGVPKVKGLK